MGSSGLKSVVTVGLVLVALIGVLDVRFASAQTPARIPAATPVKGYIGIAWLVRDPMETDYMRKRAPVVFSVQPCSPGHWAGLQPGDELIEVNDRDARDGPAFPDLKPGAVYSMVVNRGNDRIEAKMTATTVPAKIRQPVTDGPMLSPVEHGCAKSG